jgi:hypothetical protein
MIPCCGIEDGDKSRINPRLVRQDDEVPAPVDRPLKFKRCVLPIQEIIFFG